MPFTRFKEKEGRDDKHDDNHRDGGELNGSLKIWDRPDLLLPPSGGTTVRKRDAVHDNLKYLSKRLP